MPRTKRPKRRRPETLMRFVSVSEVKAGHSVHAAQERGEQPHIASTAQVELTGTMDEPVRDTRDVEIVLYPAEEAPTPGTEPMPWIGLVHGVRPVLRPAIFLSHREFDRVWTLALSGLLKHAHIVLTEPRYRSAYVVSVSFSTHPEE